jgi:hypothetical protein
VEAKELRAVGDPPFQLSLRIRHPSIDPAEISAALSIEPEHCFRAGERRHGGAAAGVHAESYWLGILRPIRRVLLGHPPADDQRLEVAEKQLLVAQKSLTWALALCPARILAPHADLLRRIRSEGGSISVLVTVCAAEVESFTLPDATSRMFGDLGITLEFELAAR